MATRYVQPLREGGSLPAVVDTDSGGLFVVKFRGAGQGAKALVAELVGGEIARAVGLRVPEIVLIDLDPEMARAEPDPEIQDLIRASGGVNVGLDYLPGSLPFVPHRDEAPDPAFAADVVWLDAYLTNVDRTPRNPNLLRWHGRIWLIDHGAALYLQHAGLDPLLHARRPFPQIADHVLLPFAESIEAAEARLAPRLSEARIAEILGAVPEAWLEGTGADAYVEYLTRRLEAPRLFGREADAARS